jgi:hypothetical protein
LNFGIAFSPLVPAYVLWSALTVASVIAAMLMLARSRGALVRVISLALFVLALANPSLTQEVRDPLTSIAAVIIDKSPSQELGDRMQQTEAARAQLAERLGHIPGLEVRFIEAGQSDGETDGTRLFTALSSALSDVPRDRIAGAIMITDGRVHDVPADAAALGFNAPVHALITGHKDDRERRVALVTTPRFGIVGQPQTITFRVEDRGASPGTAQVAIRRDGETLEIRSVRVGQPVNVDVPIPHAGPNIVEIQASPLDGQLTAINNRAVVTIDGVRDKLRVLLVSGEPNAGERTWRNLLRSDPGVDLVHFTILRPPEKQDGTPINELSLIAFPTRELFQEKINDFQLIIFDRYTHLNVLPNIYFDNIVRYVRQGGAVLVSAGPEYAKPVGLWYSPLESILPAAPSGKTTDGPYFARLSDLGKRHPVTRELEGGNEEPPHWSRWFRLVDATAEKGTTVLEGPDGKPLLQLSREGEGRVALLLSDQIWLWARGYEGGGPYLDLLRRVSHWLMREPDLEEEALRLSVRGHDLTVQRQTLGDSVGEVTLTTPSGKTRTATLEQGEPGLWRTTIEAKELGLWRASDGKLTALANVGPTNPREFDEVTSTTDWLAPLTSATGGDAVRIEDGAGIHLPRVVGVHSTDTYHGDDWIGLKIREASVVRGIGVFPVFAGLIGLLLLVGSLAATWAREGR